MPNIKSAAKRVKVTATKKLQNQMIRSQMQTAVKKFNITAKRPLPDDEFYCGYPPLENGVGMLTDLKTTFLLDLDDTEQSCIL